MSNPIKFGSRADHGAPWSFVAVEVAFTEEDAGQGSHPPYPLVATLNVEDHTGRVIEVVVGREKHIDQLIAALQITKARMKVDAKAKELDQLKGHLFRLEADLL